MELDVAAVGMDKTATDERSMMLTEEEQQVVQPEKPQQETKELEKSKQVVEKSGQQAALHESKEEKSFEESKGVTRGINNSVVHESMFEPNDAFVLCKEYSKVVSEVTTQSASANFFWGATFHEPQHTTVVSIQPDLKDDILLPLNTIQPALDVILEEVGEDAKENALLNGEFKGPVYVAAKNLQNKLEECEQARKKIDEIGELNHVCCDVSPIGMKDGLSTNSVVAVDFVIPDKFNKVFDESFSISLFIPSTKKVKNHQPLLKIFKRSRIPALHVTLSQQHILLL